jgi:hypothetical protein
LAGNHIITIVRDLDRLAEIGRRIPREGANDFGKVKTMIGAVSEYQPSPFETL